jgi:hypothetical protein
LPKLPDQPRSPTWARRGTSGLLAGIAIIAGVGCGLISTGDESRGPGGPHSTSVGSPRSTARASPTVVTGTPSPTFRASSWELRGLNVPPELAEFAIAGSSPDGAVILAIEPTAFSSAHLVTPDAVREIIVPDHIAGAPIGAQLSADGSYAVVSELGHLWHYDVGEMTYERLPDPPESNGVIGWTLGPDHALLALTGPVANPAFGTTTDTLLWKLDLQSREFVQVGSRTDGIAVYWAGACAALLVDRSQRQDNTGWVLFLICDGSDELFFDIGAAHGSASSLAVAPDGSAIAFGLPNDGGSWLVESSLAPAMRLSDGQVVDFSPDGRLIRITHPGGEVEAVDREGRSHVSLPRQPTGWVAVP